eukprot:1161446-Pelagomonas_calceolata.AAC.16
MMIREEGALTDKGCASGALSSHHSEGCMSLKLRLTAAAAPAGNMNTKGIQGRTIAHLNYAIAVPNMLDKACSFSHLPKRESRKVAVCTECSECVQQKQEDKCTNLAAYAEQTSKEQLREEHSNAFKLIILSSQEAATQSNNTCTSESVESFKEGTTERGAVACT